MRVRNVAVSPYQTVGVALKRPMTVFVEGEMIG